MIVSGSSNQPLAKKIAESMAAPFFKAIKKTFYGGEIYLELPISSHVKHPIIVQTLSDPVNENLMELLLIIESLKHQGYKHITAVVPYCAYSRQNRRFKPESAVGMEIISSILDGKIENLIFIDIHDSYSIKNFYKTKIHNLIPSRIFSNEIFQQFQRDSFNIISPDKGSQFRCSEITKLCNVDLIQCEKKRTVNSVEMTLPNGSIHPDKASIIIDDIVESGTTLSFCAAELNKNKVQNIIAFCSHGLFSLEQANKIDFSVISKIYCTNTVLHNFNLPDKIKVLDVSELIVEKLNQIL